MSRLTLGIVLLLLAQQPAAAQLFGVRQLGQPLARRIGPGMGGDQDVGQVTGVERFLRRNRGRADFVGSDQGDVRGFVGSEQGRTVGQVLSATAGLQPRRDRGAQINRPLRSPKSEQMYAPTLQVAFPVPTATPRELAAALAKELAQSDYFAAANRFEVLVQGTTAILRGEVASAAERALAEQMVRFEPGISDVRNELRSRDGALPDLPPPPSPLPLPSPPRP